MAKIIGFEYCNGGKSAVYIESTEGRQKFVLERRGRWETAGFGITERVICSNCRSSKGSYLKPPFCNQCGAIMDL